MVMDPTGYFRRIMNQSPAETFDPATDSLEAIANALGIGPSVGLWMFGIVDATQIASTITVITNNLQNIPNEVLEGQFWMQVIYNTSAPTTAPEGEIRHITNFVQGGALQTFTVDAFTANVEAGDLVIIFHESLLSQEILGTGTLTLSSATVPEDNLRLEVDNYFNGCLFMATEGACRFQPRRIVDWAVGGGGPGTGVFTLDPNNPLTGLPGLVDYVIIGDQTEFVPAVDGLNNRTPSDVIGGKADTALYAAAVNATLMRYVKGLITAGIAVQGAVSDAGPAITDFDTDLAEATDDHYNGMLLMFLDGPNAGQAHTIDDYGGAAKNVSFRVGDQWTDVPGDGNIFVILPSIGGLLAGLTTMVETNQYFDRIFFDEDTGIAGTAWPIGTPQVPSDVIADIITMCAARNLHKIAVHGALTLGAAMQHYCFFGSEHQDIADTLDLSDEDVDSSHVEGLIVTGGQGGAGFLTLIRCTVNALTLFAGRAKNCSFYTSTCSFRDASFIDLVDCESISGAVTITVQAPTRASIKNWRGNLILTAQDGGLCLVRGFKGTLEIDAMTAGTINVYANGADITINADCTGGTINIYGNANVTGAGGGVTINNYTLDVRVDRALYSMDFWSDPVEEKAVTAAQVTAAVGAAVVVAGLPAGATIVRAIVMMKFRMVENTNAAENSLDCTAVQPIQVDDSGNTGWVTCIDFVDEQFKIAATTREGGDVLIGDNDVSARVDGNDTYDFQWLNAKAHLANIQFNDIQMGIRILYSI